MDVLIPQNLSIVMVTHEQIAILSRGLSFSPTPEESHMVSIYFHFDKFSRLKLFSEEHTVPSVLIPRIHEDD